MTDRARGAEYRSTTVCIDSYAEGVMQGRLYNSWFESGKSFKSLSRFLVEMEQSMDSMGFPKAFTETRLFAPPCVSPLATPENELRKGEAATFTVKILFRQNSSWQGSVTWLEGGQEQSFRSALELILLMDNALSYSQAS